MKLLIVVFAAIIMFALITAISFCVGYFIGFLITLFTGPVVLAGLSLQIWLGIAAALISLMSNKS